MVRDGRDGKVAIYVIVLVCALCQPVLVCELC